MTFGLRFAANLKWLFTDLPFEERFDAAAAAGFRGVEYPSPYEHSARDLARRLADAGLEQALINSPMGQAGSPTQRGSACVPGAEAEFRAGIGTALEYASELGCRVVHVVAGIVPEGVSRERAFAQYVHNVGWAAEAAAGSGITLVLEAQNPVDVPGFLVSAQETSAAVAETVGGGVGILFDVYHVQTAEGGVTTSFERYRPLIRHIQVGDVPGRHEPGTGELDWAHVWRVISASGYDGWIGCEYAPEADTVAGLGWRKGVAA